MQGWERRKEHYPTRVDNGVHDERQQLRIFDMLVRFQHFFQREFPFVLSEVLKEHQIENTIQKPCHQEYFKLDQVVDVLIRRWHRIGNGYFLPRQNALAATSTNAIYTGSVNEEEFLSTEYRFRNLEQL